MPLDDNTRSGLHYLTLGVVVLFVFMLLDRWMDGFLRPADPAFDALTPFQHGYLLGDGLHLVDSRSTRGERIAWGAISAVGIGSFLGIIILRITRDRRIAMAAARIVMLLLLGWGCYSALFVPVRQFFVRDGSLVEWRYARSLPDLPIPFTRAIELHHGKVAAAPVADSSMECGEHWRLWMAADGPFDLTTSFPRSSHCVDDLIAIRSQFEEAERILNAQLGQP